jgi:hypothetical protein
MRVVVPALATRAVIMTIIPCETGQMAIEGCNITLPDGIARKVPLPPSRNGTEQSAKKRERPRTQAAAGRKAMGLGLRPSRSTAEGLPAVSPAPAQITANIIPPQPTLVIKSTSLTHGSLIIYEGET